MLTFILKNIIDIIMDRKTFLKNAVLLAGACFLPSVNFFKAKPFKHLKQNSIHKKIIIIGSGYGGAVAALRLCEKGYRVCMLEMGLNWEKSKEKFSPMISPGKSAAWLKNKTIAPFFNIFPLKKYTGVLDRLDYENIKIWMGRGVGGGSLVNGGMAVTPKKEYFKEVFPQLDADLFYQKYFPLANSELAVNFPSEEFLKECDYYKFSRVAEIEAQKSGFKTVRIPNVYDFKYMEDEYAGKVPKSALAGEVIYGNNHGKKTLNQTYLKKALATGNLEILDLHKVESIQQEEGNRYLLAVSEINTLGETVAEKQISCEMLFLAAGTMGTMELLLKSKAQKKISIDDNIGKEWGNNGNFMTGRNFVNPFSGGTGVKQSTIPVGAIDHWDDAENPFFAEIAPLPMGLNVATSLYLMINRLDKFGSVEWNPKKNAIDLNWTKQHTTKMKENARYLIRKLNKINGGTRTHFLFHNGFGHDICYHPLGGAVLGKATNNFGRLNWHKNLYIMDGSLIPGTIGVNPFVTITAVAEYCMECILEDLKTV
ncbi:GMC family oxidoreductase N-terminal domain-containing protein [Bergeyella porcorum]|uniref:GMC family oxidoreductase N-terminal domain-containing protein n=1 Tax=Bergeyella porcorum TaxID=1735111 RepID=UPI0035E8597B